MQSQIVQTSLPRVRDVWESSVAIVRVNLSVQFGFSETLFDATVYAYSNDVVMICASGNAGGSQVSYPARWPQTVAVGAIENDGTRWPSSNGGPHRSTCPV